MMKKHRRLLALLLVCLMLCSLFIGCGNNDNANDDDDTDDEKVTPSTENVDDDKDNKPSEPVDNHQHQWSDWEITTEATCSAEGVAIRSCACGETEAKPVEKTSHTEGEWVVISNPSATTSGQRALLCAVCGAQMEVESIELSAKWTYETDRLGYCNGYKTINGSSKDVIFDSFGDVVYESANGETIEIYANGYFISKISGVQYLKKFDGTIVCSTDSLEITGFGLTENYTDYTSFLSDRYVLAYKAINTYNGTEFQIGILDTDGQWIVPLSADNPIISSGTQYTADALSRHHFIYAGDGILLLPVSNVPCDHILYNIKQNVIHKVVTDVSNYMLDYYLTTAIFDNGVAYVTNQGQLYTFYSDGRITGTNLPTKSYAGFHVDEDGNRYLFGKSAIYINEQLHTELNFTASSAAWTGDAWLVLIKNPAGLYYYTYVTMDGELLFEPVETDAVYICDVGGASVGEMYEDGVKLVINYDGTVFYTSVNDRARIYLNKGVVLEELKGAFSTDKTYFFLLTE